MDLKNKTANVWTPTQIGFATFLSGPLGGCYLLARNYKAIGEDLYAKRSLIVGAIATVGLFLAYLLIDISQGFFRFFIPLAYTMFILEFAKKFQGEQLKELRNAGVQRNSHAWLVLISILFVFLDFLVAFGLGFVLSIFD